MMRLPWLACRPGQPVPPNRPHPHPARQDALDEIARQKPKDLFKPLRVHFIGEDGIDAGALGSVGAGARWMRWARWGRGWACVALLPPALCWAPRARHPHPPHARPAGGVKKEFFQLLVTELLCPDYGMLIYQPESRTYWFNPTTLEADAEFLLLGLVSGGGAR